MSTYTYRYNIYSSTVAVAVISILLFTVEVGNINLYLQVQYPR
jgi:hypothetical protein